MDGSEAEYALSICLRGGWQVASFREVKHHGVHLVTKKQRHSSSQIDDIELIELRLVLALHVPLKP